LSKVIDSIISNEQFAFISGRQILDGPLILSELGFSSNWGRWIRACLATSRASILINGSPTSEFSLKRGLRQGDPLSPFLFIILMEGLHITLKNGLTENMFRGICIGSPGIRLSHLFYVDDVIIISEWNQNDMDNIIRILNSFYLASGLKINIHKSNLYGVGVPSSEVARVAAGSGCSASTLPFSYLGLPIGSNMNRTSNWKVLIDRFKARLSAPDAVIKSLESIRASFFWSASGDKRKLAWIKWSNILASLDKGGLGSIHGDEAGFDIKFCQTNGLWARIVGSIYHIHSSGYIPLNSFRFSVRDGSLVRFWKDTWLGDSPLCTRYNRLFRLARNKNCLISDRIVNGSWSWDLSRPMFSGRTQTDSNNLMIDISSLNINVERDSPIFTLSTDNTFFVNVARNFLDDCLLPSSLPCTRWYKVLPRKVNIFIGLLFLDRLPHRLNLSSRGLDIESIMCPVCNGSVESNSHIFFSCTSASSIWRLVRGWCDLKFLLLSSCNDWDSWLLACQVTNDEKDQAYIIFASTCWTVWRFRNNIAFNS
ncbi:RNA-directed DNA polymerase, eukaryota, reverse transcriptase zinc-binding domain protein, partial [Tanacetum coccineum]